eukprot:11647683-Prorocentrum_lima.AAC.1
MRVLGCPCKDIPQCRIGMALAFATCVAASFFGSAPAYEEASLPKWCAGRELLQKIAEGLDLPP